MPPWVLPLICRFSKACILSFVFDYSWIFNPVGCLLGFHKLRMEVWWKWSLTFCFPGLVHSLFIILCICLAVFGKQIFCVLGGLPFGGHQCFLLSLWTFVKSVYVASCQLCGSSVTRLVRGESTCGFSLFWCLQGAVLVAVCPAPS